jgi:hypothetical protein
MAFRRWMGNDVNVACRFYGGEATKRCAEDLLAKSQVLVPVKTGELRASGSVEEIGETRTGNVIYEVRYESDKEYDGGTFRNAVAQHEDLTYKHEQGEAKYLEKPYKENVELYKQIIAEEIRKGMKGAIR